MSTSLRIDHGSKVCVKSSTCIVCVEPVTVCVKSSERSVCVAPVHPGVEHASAGRESQKAPEYGETTDIDHYGGAVHVERC
jgi:hypothetical protein